MKKLFILVSFLPLLISCIRGGEALAKLDDVFSYIESRPDSALTVLEGMNEDDLISKRSKAKHALLYSMALDKNWIDLASDSIIAPAVSYYNNHGSAEEKLLTFYYRGRIAMNAGKYEDAISYFVRAEGYADAADNDIAIARLYKAQTKVYQYCYDTERMIKSAELAALAYIKSGDSTRYLNSVNDVISAYLMREDTLNTRKYLAVFKNNWNALSLKQKSIYYSGLLFLNEYTVERDAESVIYEYFCEVDNPQMINWLSVADAYVSISKFKEAYEALKKYKQYGGKTTGGYLWINGLACQELGFHTEAIDSYRKCLEVNSDRNGYLFNTDVRFIKERYSNEIQILRKNLLLIIVCLCALILVLLIILAVFKIKQINIEKLQAEEQRRIVQKQKEEYVRMYNATLSEVDELKQSLKLSKLSQELRSHISERLAVLNKFITAHISDNYTQTAKEELSKLMQNRDQFIESTRLTFYFTYPKFLAYLKKLNLTNKEIGYCCLYAIGLKGKEISHYIGNHGQYKFNGDIRSKLGLSPHDTNLDIYLRKLLEKLS